MSTIYSCKYKCVLRVLFVGVWRKKRGLFGILHSTFKTEKNQSILRLTGITPI